jgi:hypothetical protein
MGRVSMVLVGVVGMMVQVKSTTTEVSILPQVAYVFPQPCAIRSRFVCELRRDRVHTISVDKHSYILLLTIAGMNAASTDCFLPKSWGIGAATHQYLKDLFFTRQEERGKSRMIVHGRGLAYRGSAQPADGETLSCRGKEDDVTYCTTKLAVYCRQNDTIGQGVAAACPILCKMCQETTQVLPRVDGGSIKSNSPKAETRTVVGMKIAVGNQSNVATASKLRNLAYTYETTPAQPNDPSCPLLLPEHKAFKDDGFMLPPDHHFTRNPSELSAQRCHLDPVVGVPRIIFLYWAQGWGDCDKCARELHQSVAFAWLMGNVNWNTVLLDDGNLDKWLDVPSLPGLIPSKGATFQGKSDIIRVALMHKYGGVWADATLGTGAPLEQWLRVDPLTGFFAFRYPHGYQAASYFLAVAPGSVIVAKWAAASTAFWANLEVFTVDVDNYFWVHHAFGNLYKSDTEFKQLWGNPGSEQDLRSGEARAAFVDCQRKSAYQVFKCSQRKCRNKCAQITVDITAMQRRMGAVEWSKLVQKLDFVRLPSFPGQ